MKKLVDFKKYSSIKIGPELEIEEIDKIDVKYEQYFIIGRANNLLVSPNTEKNIAILGKEFEYIKIEDNKLKVGCATKSGKIHSFCKKNNIANFELMAGLPGCLGGIIKMNAGLKQYEVFNHLDSILTCEGYIKRDEIEYGYRFTNIDKIVYEAVFDIEYGYNEERKKELVAMRKNQPHDPSAGSCFKNPVGDYAGRLIEAVGLKGKANGGMEFSKVHANFLVNNGGGTYEEAMELITIVKQKVKEEFHIELQEEIIII